jgi:hypothetical protein
VITAEERHAGSFLSIADTSFTVTHPHYWYWGGELMVMDLLHALTELSVFIKNDC